MTPFADLLRRYRKRENFNQKELASLVGIKQSYLSALETGSRIMPSDFILREVVSTLNLNKKEEEKLFTYKHLCSQTIVPPKTASITELKLAAEFGKQLGYMPEELAIALHSMLDVNRVKSANGETK